MQKILLLKGLPASGKTTYAKELLKKGNWKRVNKDELRSMIDDGAWSKKKEQFILNTRDMLVSQAIEYGYNIIVDDTNFAPKHLSVMEAIADRAIRCGHEVIIETKVFDVGVDECIKRDLVRPNSVGSRVIRKMYNQYINKVQTINQDENLQSVVLCDIDGTLAKMISRSPFDWAKVGTDELKYSVAKILKDSSHDIIVLTGRDAVCREETEEWLERNGIEYKELLMREEGDNRKDAIVKKEIYENRIKGKYCVEYILDDRDQVVDMWRSLGLTCLQVDYGDF